MRVTLVSPYDPDPPAAETGKAHVGGVEQVFSRLSKGLVDRGHDVTILCSSSQAPIQEDNDGARWVRVRRKGTLFRDPVVHLARHIPQETDLVHVAATYPFTTPTVLRRARKDDIPAVLDFHFEPKPNTQLGKVGASVYRRLGPLTYRWADAVLVRSKSYAKQAPSLEPVPKDRWRILPNGVDPTRFHVDGGSQPGDYLLFVGRLVPYKGLEVLLQALARKDLSLPLLIAGEGPLREQLETLADDLNVDARFLGRVSDEELPDLYRNARVTLLPSVNRQEAFGITLVESMACGTPVVASKLPGVQDVARNGGLLAPPGDPVLLSERIQEALHPDRLPRGDKLSQRIHGSFSWDAITKRLEGVYEDVLSKPGDQAR